MEKDVEVKEIFDTLLEHVMDKLDPKLKDKVELAMTVNEEVADRIRDFCESLSKVADTYQDVFKLLNIGIVIGFSTMEKCPCAFLAGTKIGIDKVFDDLKEQHKEVK